MKLTVKTETLKDMISKAVKGASNNKLVPLTSLMALKVKDNALTIITSDATNYLYITNKVENEDFYVVVQVEQFSKLISKLTCENVVLEVTDHGLMVKGNGNYTIDIPLDEGGVSIEYPDPVANIKFKDKGVDVSLTTIQTILTSCRPALAVTMEVPVYTNYYAGGDVIATDTSKITSYDVELVKGKELLLPAELMNLLEVITEEKVTIFLIDNKVVFRTPTCTIYGYQAEGIEDFAVEPISNLVTQEFPSNCKVSKDKLLAILDRIGLFVGTYDNKSIKLTFTDTGINVESMKSNGIESIEYKEVEDFKPFTALVDIDMLTTQLKANTQDIINIHYGLDNCIKIVDDNITQVIALLEENE